MYIEDFDTQIVSLLNAHFNGAVDVDLWGEDFADLESVTRWATRVRAKNTALVNTATAIDALVTASDGIDGVDDLSMEVLAAVYDTRGPYQRKIKALALGREVRKALSGKRVSSDETSTGSIIFTSMALERNEQDIAYVSVQFKIEHYTANEDGD